MMKKLLVILCAVAGMLASCDSNVAGGNSQQSAIDSLEAIIEQKDSEINDMVGTLTEIQSGFDIINEAEGRVNLMKSNAENNSTAANIRENMEFIQQTLADNKRKIAELESKLKSSSINSSKMKEAIAKLTAQLEEKGKELEALRIQLEEKDIVIAHLTDSVSNLTTENTTVKQQKDEAEQVVRNQDKQINTAWYVYGTSRELKDQKILIKGDVLKGDYNKEYLTEIDIRKTTVIPLNSKSAELLTTHPAGSYTLLKDSKGEYTLRITDINKFWSVSRYLVMKVK